MTQTPAGWYPEPDPAYADQPGRLRYWDGSAWTEHVHQPTAPLGEAAPAAAPPTYAPQGYQQGYQPQTGYYAPGYGYPPVYQDTSSRDATPDGAELAGWWMRALALLLDGILMIPLYAAVAVPVILSQRDAVEQWSDDMDYAAANGLADPALPGVFWVAIGLVFVASLAWQFLFLWWKQATPGKLITGLRVRLRERPELPVGAIALRLLGSFLIGLCSIAVILDYLWPLWDGNRQSLHDKMAKTNVVKKR